jgi:N-acetylglucosamine-6-sulfatase
MQCSQSHGTRRLDGAVRIYAATDGAKGEIGATTVCLMRRGVGMKVPAAALVLIIVAGATAWFEPSIASSPESTAGRRRGDTPNVVLVMADDMRYDDLDRVADLKPDGGFDWLRDHGTRFPKLWTTNNLCCPGRATILTGQTSYNHKVFTNTPYQELANTLPEWLQDAGYCTGFTGKYMNAYTATKPRPLGWTYWEPLTAGYENERGYTIMRRNGETSRPGAFITDQLAEVSRSQLADCLEHGKPAFVALWTYAPHFGSDPEPDYADVAVAWSNSDPTFDEADVSDKPAWLQSKYPVSRAVSGVAFGDLRLDPAYVAANSIQHGVRTLLSVDDALRSLIDDLKDRDELDNTLLILTSDNGYLFFEHRLAQKTYAYEAAQPALWIAGPGFPAGATSDAFATNRPLPADLRRGLRRRRRSATRGSRHSNLALQVHPLRRRE